MLARENDSVTSSVAMILKEALLRQMMGTIGFETYDFHRVNLARIGISMTYKTAGTA
jgi:hypothetical protein